MNSWRSCSPILPFCLLGKAQAAGRFELGRVGAGVAVSAGVPVPDISGTDALKDAVLQADSVAIQNHTVDTAALAAEPVNPEGAPAFPDFLASPAAKALLIAQGVE